MLLPSLLSTCAVLVTLSLDALAGPSRRSFVPPGFATAKGTQFEVDGKPFVRILTFTRKAKLIESLVGLCRG